MVIIVPLDFNLFQTGQSSTYTCTGRAFVLDWHNLWSHTYHNSCDHFEDLGRNLRALPSGLDFGLSCWLGSGSWSGLFGLSKNMCMRCESVPICKFAMFGLDRGDTGLIASACWWVGISSYSRSTSSSNWSQLQQNREGTRKKKQSPSQLVSYLILDSRSVSSLLRLPISSVPILELSTGSSKSCTRFWQEGMFNDQLEPTWPGLQSIV
jgi:hypothetical protein